MISRRLVRIKTLQALYAWQQGDEKSTSIQEERLFERIHESYEFYQFLLDLPYHFAQYLQSKAQLEQAKFYPDQNKIRQYGIFTRMPLVRYLHREVENANTNFQWSDLENNFDNWFNTIQEWQETKEINIFDEPEMELQKSYLKLFFDYFIDQSEDFNTSLEEVYPQWSDDDPYTHREIIKTIESAKANGSVTISTEPSLNAEEVVFAKNLLRKTATNSTAYEQQISEVTSNWDPQRIATIDLLIIKLTLSEFLHMKEIPVKVTINEYLEITKNYSTPNSSKFVNGILDKLRMVLDDQGLIKKEGRGLREK